MARTETSRSVIQGDVADVLRIEYDDGTFVETTMAVESGEQQRRARVRRLRAYLRNASPTVTETVAAVKDVIREIGHDE